MGAYDTIIRGGSLVAEAGVILADIAIADGRIVLVEPEITGACDAEISATGLHVFPGAIDAHVHCNEPGRTDWEGFATATLALAAGGATSFFDMPLNAHPPTLDAASFDQKLACAQASSLLDFALWGGLTPRNLDQMEALAERGVIGFKAFMSNSGIDDFLAVDDVTLYAGMVRAAELGRIVAVHAESESITSRLAADAIQAGRTGIRDYLRSRPVLAEQEAIGRAILFAQEAGCALHIVHVSSGAGMALIAAAQSRGVDVTCETCPHYLFLTEEDVVAMGAVAKCAPPLRDAATQAALWANLPAVKLPMVVSDHSPSPASMKGDADFFKVWGGISGCQSTLALLLTACLSNQRVALPDIAAWISGNIARRFGVHPRKGTIAPGADADLCLVDLGQKHVLTAGDLYYRHAQSPYLGRSFMGRVQRTLVRGRTILAAGRLTGAAPAGRLLRPAVANPA